MTKAPGWHDEGRLNSCATEVPGRKSWHPEAEDGVATMMGRGISPKE
jgi:hypothetical protein